MCDENKKIVERRKKDREIQADEFSMMLGIRVLPEDEKLKLNYDENGKLTGSSYPAHIEIRGGGARWVIG